MAPAQPTTIKQYQSALARLGVPLPANGGKKLADYAQIYTEAMAAKIDAENQAAAENRSKSPRPTKNIPLSQQTPDAGRAARSPRPTRNIPLSKQTPPPPAPTPSPRLSAADHNSIPDDASPEADPAEQIQSKKAASSKNGMLLGALFVAALLSLGGAAAYVTLNASLAGMDEGGTASSLLAEDAAEPRQLLLLGDDITTPPPACDDETNVDEASTSLTSPPVEVEVAPAEEEESKEPPTPSEEPQAAHVATASASSTEGGDASASDAPAADVVTTVVVDPTHTEGSSSSAAPAPAVPVAGEDDSGMPSVLGAVLGVLTALTADAVHVTAYVGVQLSQSVQQSESLRWLGRALLDGWWAAMQLLLRTVLNLAAMMVTGATELLARALPWLAEAAPAAARAVVQSCIAHPQLVAASVAALGAVHLVLRSCVWVSRWRGGRRDGKRAGDAAQVDATARWVLGELRVHAQRWRSVGGPAVPLAPADLRGRVPHTILADRQLWEQVAASVRAHSCVTITRAGEDEGWMFCGDELVMS